MALERLISPLRYLDVHALTRETFVHFERDRHRLRQAQVGKTEGSNDEGDADLDSFGVTFLREVITSDEIGAGLGPVIGTKPCTCSVLAEGVARTRGSGTGIFKD